jgi:hypothetical protein
MTKYYICYATDLWKTNDSARVKMITQDQKTLTDMLIQSIEEGAIGYNNAGEDPTDCQQMMAFKRDLKERGFDFAVGNLEYASVEEAEDGDILC